MRPLLDELPRTRSSLRVSSQDGGKSSSSSSRGDAAWNASPPLCQSRKRNQSSFFLALAVAAGVALGLLFGARDALVRGGSVLQSTLASELVERLESQSSLLDYALAERDRLARLLGEAQARAREAQETAAGAASAARALHSQAARGGAALAEAVRERDAAVAEAEAARRQVMLRSSSSSEGSAAAAAGAAAAEKEEGGDDGGGLSLPADRHTPWAPSRARDRRDPQLAALLRRTANARGEVMVALCNEAYARGGPGGMLATWARTAVAAGVANALVLAMDEEAARAAEASGVAAFLLEEEWRQLPAAQQQQAGEEEEKEEDEVLEKKKNESGVRKSKSKSKAVAVATNHSVSALKFKLLRRILALGYSVLLSDVDVVTLRDPFGFFEEEEEEEEGRTGGRVEEEEGGERGTTVRRRRRRYSFLKRDSDLEAMSDGWDAATAYGFDDVLDVPAMGWARFAHSTRVFALNSGLFFARPTLAADDVLARVAARVASERGSWDQAVFNEVALLPSAEGYYSPAPRVRVMAIGEFMNSKVLFAKVRHELADAVSGAAAAAEEAEGGGAKTASSSSSSPSSSLPFPPPSFPLPVMVHVNYHPDKLERMRGVVRYFLGGDAGALEAFPDGSEW